MNVKESLADQGQGPRNGISFFERQERSRKRGNGYGRENDRDGKAG